MFKPSLRLSVFYIHTRHTTIGHEGRGLHRIIQRTPTVEIPNEHTLTQHCEIPNEHTLTQHCEIR